MEIQANKVFVAGGLPNATYVHREHLGLEARLREELFAGHQIVCVTGPTKSGKSVLCKTVIGDRNNIWLHGGQIGSESEFWEQAAEKLALSDEISTTSSLEGGAGVSLGPVQAGGTKGSSTTRTSRSNSKTSVLKSCLSNDTVLIVDDFHYLDHDLQRRIIQSLKSEIFDGLSAVLIAVPHRAFDVVLVQKEMEGRFANVEIPRWEQDDLLKIPELGFPTLNAAVAADVCSSLAREAFGSPLLMQRFCLKICQKAGLLAREPQSITLNIQNETLESIFSEVAQQFGFPAYKRLSEGPQSRSDRMERQFRNGAGSADIYQAVLVAAAMAGPNERTHYNEIRENLRTLLRDGDVPQKHEVSNALRNMTEIAKSKISGEPVLEWMDDTLYLTDPMLMFYMRWSQKHPNALVS